jgi:ferredoxin-NADP reductase
MTLPSLLSVRVAAMRYEAERIVSVELVSSTGEALPPFAAGAHIDLHLPNSVVRSYSLSNSPGERERYVVGVLNDRNSRGGSSYVHEKLRVGATIRISVPRNLFALDASASHSVLIAGGIGITPIACMFNELRQQGKSVELLYCARSRGEAAFATTLLPQQGVTAHFDADAGAPPDLRAILATKPASAHFYCCGPTAMLNAFEAACAALGLANVHVERFAPAEPVAATQNGSYVAQLARSNKTITVTGGKSLLDALLEAGVQVEHSCREGICGACETRVLDGQPDHRDTVLSQAERVAGKSMMVCVSGCKGQGLTLDL